MFSSIAYTASFILLCSFIKVVNYETRSSEITEVHKVYNRIIGEDDILKVYLIEPTVPEISMRSGKIGPENRIGFEKLSSRFKAALVGYHENEFQFHLTDDELIYITVNDKFVSQQETVLITSSGNKALSTIAEFVKRYPALKVAVLAKSDHPTYMNLHMWQLRTDRIYGLVSILENQFKIQPSRVSWIISQPYVSVPFKP